MSHPRYICIHGHFYQPPRENPWLESVELQDSAAPYHDWNARITAECYGPCGASRIHDEHGMIEEIQNNYAWMSFNFGPTLLSWLETHAPVVHQSIVDADAESCARCDGHGNAIAQVYNHMIMPLANRRDKATQVRWGIADFQRRFSRRPEGMWLAETAVDVESLEVLAEHGILFTVLAPGQAARVRRLSTEGEWTDVGGARVDPTRPYLCRLPSGRSIALFFYDGPISQAVAFEGLLNDGVGFAHRLLSGLSNKRDFPQMLHIATDGESYGHHHKFGDMALARAIKVLNSRSDVVVTNYGHFLSLHPPTWEVQIWDKSSWSCAKGVKRWAGNCEGECYCNAGHSDWKQTWRAPLRGAMDWLRDHVAPLFAQHAADLFRDPWAARDAYVDVMMNRTTETVDAFLRQHGRCEMGPRERSRALKLMEVQRQALFMFTSCAWFFDEISGIETVQNIQYAARCLLLMEELSGQSLEADFVKRLSEAPSNIPHVGNGAQVYHLYARPAAIELERLAANHAITSMFHDAPMHHEPGEGFRMTCDDVRSLSLGEERLVSGRLSVVSQVTLDERDLLFVAVNLGGYNVLAYVAPFDAATLEDMHTRAAAAFDCGKTLPVAEMMRAAAEKSGRLYGLDSLLRDDLRQVTSAILRNAVDNSLVALRTVYDENAALMRFVTNLHVPLPRVLRETSALVLNMNLLRLINDDHVTVLALMTALDEMNRWGFEINQAEIGYALQMGAERHALALRANPKDIDALERLATLVELARKLPFQVIFWQAQNIVYSLQKRVERGDEKIPKSLVWTKAFERVCEDLGVKTRRT